MKINWGGFKQIHDLFVINFKVATSHQEIKLRAFLGFNLLPLFFNCLKDIFKRPLHDASFFKFSNRLHVRFSTVYLFFTIDHDTRSLNGESFTCSCLTIGKNRTIVSLQTTVSNRLGNWWKYNLLFNVFIANEIEIKRFKVRLRLYVYCRFILNCDTFFMTSIIYLNFRKILNSNYFFLFH